MEDLSEQFVVGASMAILRQESNNRQLTDPGLNPVILVRVPESISTWKDLEAMRDALFPPEPTFVVDVGNSAGRKK